MTRFVYYTAVTLDGFIADENNSLEWLFEVARDGKRARAVGHLRLAVVMRPEVDSYRQALDRVQGERLDGRG